MAAGRILKKKISRDARVNQLSLPAKLAYTWAIPHLDREGRMSGVPSAVRGTVVPLEAFTDSDVAGWIDEWTRTVDRDGHLAPLVIRYHDPDGLPVLQWTGFKKNQRVPPKEAASDYAPPPADLFADAELHPPRLPTDPPEPGDSPARPVDNAIALSTSTLGTPEVEVEVEGEVEHESYRSRAASPLAAPEQPPGDLPPEPHRVDPGGNVVKLPRRTQARTAVEEVERALVDAIGRKPVTRSEVGRVKHAARELADAGATVDEVRGRVAEYRRRWPTVELTATAVAANWTALARRATSRSGGMTAEEIRELAELERERERAEAAS